MVQPIAESIVSVTSFQPANIGTPAPPLSVLVLMRVGVGQACFVSPALHQIAGGSAGQRTPNLESGLLR